MELTQNNLQALSHSRPGNSGNKTLDTNTSLFTIFTKATSVTIQTTSDRAAIILK